MSFGTVGQSLLGLKDERAASLLTAIDYTKAFNHLNFQHCLRACAQKGVYSDTIALLATFVFNRKMSVRNIDTCSTLQPVYGGVNQGSILGGLLFSIEVGFLFSV